MLIQELRHTRVLAHEVRRLLPPMTLVPHDRHLVRFSPGFETLREFLDRPERTARIVSAMPDEQGRADVLREVDRGSVSVQFGVLLGLSEVSLDEAPERRVAQIVHLPP